MCRDGDVVEEEEEGRELLDVGSWFMEVAGKQHGKLTSDSRVPAAALSTRDSQHHECGVLAPSCLGLCSMANIFTLCFNCQ